jgi:hypothetical protein
LVITRARGRHSGEYECVAITEVDVTKASSSLIVRDVPEQPVVTTIECNQRHAKIVWTAGPQDDTVTAYTVQYHTDFHPNRWLLALRDDDTSRLRQAQSFSAEMSLSPWVNYTFRVIAENEHGLSMPASLNVPCNTAPSVPYTNPINASAEGDAPDNLVIFWAPMEKEQWNGETFRYVVRYRFDSPGAEWHEFEVEDPLQDRVVLRDQPTFRKYLVQVGARNKHGDSLTPPETVSGYSGESGKPYE